MESYLNQRTDVASTSVNPCAHPRKFLFRTPATLTLLVLTSGAFIVQIVMGGDAAEQAFGIIPARFTGSDKKAADGQPIAAWLTLLTYMFLHCGWWHVAMNMAGLASLGWYAEPAMTTRRFGWSTLASVSSPA